MPRKKKPGRPKKKNSVKAAQVMISIPRPLLKKWSEVADMYGWTKSGMIRDFLLEVLPVLENADKPKKMIKTASKEIKKISKQLSLLDDEL